MTATWSQIPIGETLKRVERFEPTQVLTDYTFAGTYSFGRGIFVGERKTGAAFKLPKIQRIHTDDFVYCKIMAWEGAFGLVPQEADNCVMSGAFVAYEIDRRLIEPAFLDWYFRSPNNWQRIGRQSTGTNVRRQSLHPKQFESTTIQLPPLEEQRRIVERIELLTERVKEAHSIRERTAKELVAIASGASKEILANSEWACSHLKDVCEIITDGTHQTPRYVDEGAIFLSAQNVKPFRFLPDNHRKVSFEDFAFYTARNKPRRGDVLLTRVGAGIGEAALVDQDIDFAIYVSIALIRTVRDRLLPEFLVFWLNSPGGAEQSRGQTLGRGHSQGNLNLNLLREFIVPTPTLDVQRRVVKELTNLYSNIDEVRRLQSDTAGALASLGPSVLDRAFRGEL